MAKTDKNIYFITVRPISLLSLTLRCCTFFLVFEKISSFRSKHKGVSISFYQQTSVHGKNWTKIHICPYGVHVLSWLDTTMLYTIFLIFWKISSFGSKRKEVSHRFYQKIFVHGKKMRKIQILSLWGTYSFLLDITVMYTIFLRLWKISSFSQNQKGLFFSFTDKRLFTVKTGQNPFLSLWVPYSSSVRHYSIVHNLFRF
jgi:hypothetical protein